MAARPPSPMLTALKSVAAQPAGGKQPAPTDSETPYDSLRDPAWNKTKLHLLHQGDFREYINKLKPADRSKVLHMLTAHEKHIRGTA